MDEKVFYKLFQSLSDYYVLSKRAAQRILDWVLVAWMEKRSRPKELPEGERKEDQ